MSLFLDPSTDKPAAKPNVGERQFMALVDGRLAAGLAVSGAAAWAVSEFRLVRDALLRVGLEDSLQPSLLGVALIASPLILLLMAWRFLRKGARRGAGVLFWTIAILIGGSLGLLTTSYTDVSLVSTFLVTASGMMAASLLGRMAILDLNRVGKAAAAVLVGLLLALTINLLLGDPLAELVLNVAGVVLFATFIVTDTQRLAALYGGRTGQVDADLVSLGALTLLIDTVSLFDFLLPFAGRRRR